MATGIAASHGDQDILGRKAAVDVTWFGRGRCAMLVIVFAVTVFADGRALVQGTTDVTLARSLYARFIGS